jgi:hypothetical protein
MAIEFKKEAVSGAYPEIWRGECKILPGGFKPLQEFSVGTVLRRATPIFVDFDTMSAAVCKTAKVVGGTAASPRVAKGHYFEKGDTVTKYDDGSASPTIKAIDKSNTDYDVLTLSASIKDLTTDDIIVESTEYTAAAGDVAEAKAEPKYTPNMVVGSVTEFNGRGIPTIDAAFEAVVLTPALSTPVLAEWLNGVFLKNNPNIIFIKQ